MAKKIIAANFFMEMIRLAKMMGPRFKQCRRLGLNVCGHPKAMDRSVRGKARDDKKLTEYGTQLLEKQRLRAYYGVLEKQFVKYYEKAKKSKEMTGPAMIKMLETRLDNMTYKMGFASSIRQARQMVVHGHILVNGKKINIPSYNIKPGDILSLREKSRKNELFNENFVANISNALPYIEKNKEDFSAKLVRIPERDEINIEIDDQLIVEFYSKN